MIKNVQKSDVCLPLLVKFLNSKMYLIPGINIFGMNFAKAKNIFGKFSWKEDKSAGQRSVLLTHFPIANFPKWPTNVFLQKYFWQLGRPVTKKNSRL